MSLRAPLKFIRTAPIARSFSILSRNLIKTNRLSLLSSIKTTKLSIPNQIINNKRQYSVIENESNAPIIDFIKMNEIVKNFDSNKYVIVDVRENDEFNAGHIPNAINIPCKSSPGALGLHPDEFKLSFGFDKPSTDKTLIFYCLAGVRSTMSEELAGTFGYENRLNYLGSFKDWMNNHGEIEIPKIEEESTEEKVEKKD